MPRRGRSRIDALALPGILLVLAAVGMAGWAIYTTIRWTLAYRWPAVPCTIESSRIGAGRGNHIYVFEVRYRYIWGDKEYVGETYREDDHGTWDIAEPGRLVRAYPEGARRSCYLDPRRPTVAVLEHDNPLLPLTVAVFMLWSGSALGSAFLRSGPAPLALGAPFVLVMSLAGYVGFFGLPLLKGLCSLGWGPVPATVVSSEVRVGHRHSWPASYTVYWADVVYEYRAGGITYRSNTDNPTDVGSPWYYGARGVALRHPAGSRVTCYGDPSDPSRAVLSRRISGTQLFGIWPLILGGMMIVEILRPITGRGLRLGSPRLWGTLALGMATFVSLQVFVATGSDLLRDRRAGIAEGPEEAAVLVAGLTAAALVGGWIALAHRHGRAHRRRPEIGKGHGTRARRLWDREIDA
jgi:hypothetical protein